MGLIEGLIASLGPWSWLVLALVLAGVALVALLAKVSFFIGPIPITGQTLGVIVVGAALGARRGRVVRACRVGESAPADREERAGAQPTPRPRR